jgi:hypothetical protein
MLPAARPTAFMLMELKRNAIIAPMKIPPRTIGLRSVISYAAVKSLAVADVIFTAT